MVTMSTSLKCVLSITCCTISNFCAKICTLSALSHFREDVLCRDFKCRVRKNAAFVKEAKQTA